MSRERPPRRARALASVDGTILPAARARVSILDRGFLYGEAFFETLRLQDGRLVDWRPHLRRLHASLAAFAIPRPAADLEAAARALVAASGLREGTLRLTVTAGTGEGLERPAGLRPTVVMTVRPLSPALGRHVEHGIAAVRLGFGRGLARADAGHKSVAYLGSIAGRSAAARAGADDGFFVEADGQASEATAGNLMVVLGRRLRTPPPTSGCLPGVTRATVLALARRCGLDVREETIAASSLAGADEILVTGSVAGILSVVRLDGRAIGSGRPGPVSLRLREALRAHVARSLAADARRETRVKVVARRSHPARGSGPAAGRRVGSRRARW